MSEYTNFANIKARLAVANLSDFQAKVVNTYLEMAAQTLRHELFMATAEHDWDPKVVEAVKLITHRMGLGD